MNILAILIVGGVVGWLASKLMGRNEGILASIVIGVIGSFIGSFVSMFFMGSDKSYLAFDLTGAFWSLIGTIILVAILNAISSRQHRHGV